MWMNHPRHNSFKNQTLWNNHLTKTEKNKCGSGS